MTGPASAGSCNTLRAASTLKAAIQQAPNPRLGAARMRRINSRWPWTMACSVSMRATISRWISSGDAPPCRFPIFWFLSRVPLLHFDHTTNGR
jgi:hypothetical protein